MAGETVTMEVRELVEDISPALEILWAIHCDVQGHPCRYQTKTESAINGLTKLLEISQGART